MEVNLEGSPSRSCLDFEWDIYLKKVITALPTSPMHYNGEWLIVTASCLAPQKPLSEWHFT